MLDLVRSYSSCMKLLVNDRRTRNDRYLAIASYLPNARGKEAISKEHTKSVDTSRLKNIMSLSSQRPSEVGGVSRRLQAANVIKVELEQETGEA